MHLVKISIHPEKYPDTDMYPFNLELLQHTREILLHSQVTFFVGENGSGKSTLLKAIANRCGIHIWRTEINTRIEKSPYEEELYKFLSIKWQNGSVPGSFFGSEVFKDFAQYLDEWAVTDPRILDYFGGKSLLAQSHGQSIMSLFRARYRIKGLYLMDEPETALSPKSQIELLRVIIEMSNAGHAQFIIATHSPLLMACPEAEILSFDNGSLKQVNYEETEHYRIYKQFMEDRESFMM
ncbi:MAG: AAA family ATPase [Deltaproteobacteria bacterium]|nr:AAA family ATPase [Deltaproteobacteria bacterium]